MIPTHNFRLLLGILIVSTKGVVQAVRELSQRLFFWLPGHDRHLTAFGQCRPLFGRDSGLHDMQARRSRGEEPDMVAQGSL
jgi:hypothetical protein